MRQPARITAQRATWAACDGSDELAILVNIREFGSFFRISGLARPRVVCQVAGRKLCRDSTSCAAGQPCVTCGTPLARVRLAQSARQVGPSTR
jgi:hypothetical protein